MKKKRLDVLLTENGLCDSRSTAQRFIMAGEVLVDGQLASKPSQLFNENSQISLKKSPRYVSRGGNKLEKALAEFQLCQLGGWICVDVGSSTGGFTDCLLKHGAQKVYAVDVGYGQLHLKLRNDPRVIAMERTNVKNIVDFQEKIDLVTIDASFISLKNILPIVKKWNKNRELVVVALIKPQFEVGRKVAAKGKGVVRDEGDRQQVIEELVAFSVNEGFEFINLVESPLIGPKGNKEFLIHLVHKK